MQLKIHSPSQQVKSNVLEIFHQIITIFFFNFIVSNQTYWFIVLTMYRINDSALIIDRNKILYMYEILRLWFFFLIKRQVS